MKNNKENISNKTQEQKFYAIPLRDTVIFPRTTTTILVGRKKSINSVEEAFNNKSPIFAVIQNEPDIDDFTEKNLHKVGTICKIIELIKTPDGNLKAILQGFVRAKIDSIIEDKTHFFCKISLLPEQKADEKDKELIGLIKACAENFARYSQYNKKITPEIINELKNIKTTHDILYFIAGYCCNSITQRQSILGENILKKKFYKLLEIIKTEIEIGEAEERINRSIQEKFTKHQKEIYFNEQLKNIKKELGQEEDPEIKELKNKIAKLKLPKEVSKKCETELQKLQKTHQYSSESGVVRNYLDWICSLPWSVQSDSIHNLKNAKQILDKHHYGLEKVKERILEFIAVQIKTKGVRGPILCLIGAPGVGKTSLARSIAESLNRKYVKVSLGGVKDESEIRGHRRTYVGAMPGRIIQSMRKAETINPLMLLDEIDKISSDFRGDPASALLEVLDPEQNCNFSDHYLEVDYDLSKVIFVATANSINSIPIPLRDRMEVINVSGYTENEKLQITQKHLIPKLLKENGLNEDEFSIDKEAIILLIRRYTFEAGVRNLNRELENLIRKSVKLIISKEAKKIAINSDNLKTYSGPAKKDFGRTRIHDVVGVATGMAYTQYGGDLLEIEALKFEGSGKVQITGSLGDVMKESVQASLSYVRSIAKSLKIDAKKFNKFDFHIHVPEGATPKDGPSAGVAISVCLASVLCEQKIDRLVAMTGEITLSGKVLEIGGLKEKLLASLRGGIKKVLIPKNNLKDLEEMPQEVIKNLKIVPIETIEEALQECLINFKKSRS
ncbi:MAG: endopeptidase La [Proteobacteria bacterium]|nr:endopeptidase La [Pseudomonadota bacterium]NCA27941.1 endopeptidase La [Pseudomonadota bacterium]